jgi:putative transposase
MRPVFGISTLAERLIETLLQLRLQGVYKLHAFLVLPTRVHLILSPSAGMPISRAVELIEATFARHLDSIHAVWELGFESHPVHGIRNLERLRTHLHELPVRTHLTRSPELYPYSSASRTR